MDRKSIARVRQLVARGLSDEEIARTIENQPAPVVLAWDDPNRFPDFLCGILEKAVRDRKVVSITEVGQLLNAVMEVWEGACPGVKRRHLENDLLAILDAVSKKPLPREFEAAIGELALDIDILKGPQRLSPGSPAFEERDETELRYLEQIDGHPCVIVAPLALAAAQILRLLHDKLCPGKAGDDQVFSSLPHALLGSVVQHRSSWPKLIEDTVKEWQLLAKGNYVHPTTPRWQAY